MNDPIRHDPLDFVQRCQSTLGAFLAHDLTTELSALCTCLDAFPRNRTERETAMAVAAVCALARGVFDRLTPSCADVPRRSTRSTVTRALDRVRTHFRAGDLSLTGVADDLHVSHTYLSRSFSSHTGHGFSAYVNGLRVLAAVRLLRMPDRQIQSVATAVGYCSTRELDRQFQKCFGVAPKRFEGLLKLIPERVLSGHAR